MSSRSSVGAKVRSAVSGSLVRVRELWQSRGENCVDLLRDNSCSKSRYRRFIVIFVFAISLSQISSLGNIANLIALIDSSGATLAFAQDTGAVVANGAPEVSPLVVGEPAGVGQYGSSPLGKSPLSSGVFWTQTLLYVSIGWLLLHLLIVKPKAREEDEHKKFIDSLKKGDEVIVNSSFLGKVIVVKPDVISVELAPDVKVRVLPKALSARNGGTSVATSTKSEVEKVAVKKSDVRSDR